MKSKSSNKEASFVSASLAIVDGTHLVLLPSADGGGVGGATKIRPRSSTNDKKSHQPIDSDYGEEDCIIVVPALPLSSVWKICGREYISCAEIGENGAVFSKKDQAGDCDEEALANSTSGPLPCIETLRLRSSDLTNADYRFIHSEGLANDPSTASLPIRVVLCHEFEEGGIVLTDDVHAEVFLPSFTSSDFEYPLNNDYEEDYGKVYRGECYNIVGDDDCMDVDHGGNETSMNDLCAFEIQGAGSCLVADFLGLAGYEQALVLPRLDSNLLSNVWGPGTEDEKVIEQRKQLLQTLLRNSFITDGSGILLSKQMKLSVSSSKIDGKISFTIPPVLEMQRNAAADTASPLEMQQDEAAGSSELLTQEESQSNNKANKDLDPTDVNSAKTDTMTQEEPPWLEAIAQTVEHRLAKEMEETEQLESSAQACSELVYEGRKTLHEASRPNHLAEGENDPEVFRLRYGTRPRSSVEPCGGITVVLDLELDIIMHGNVGKEDPNESKRDSTNSNVLHDFHLSCSLANNNHSQTSTTATTPKNIRTMSGVVPTLGPDDCITVLASVHLTDLGISMKSDASTLDISIQGLWIDGSKELENDSWNPANKPPRRGAVLCILRLPVESLLLSPPISSLPQSAHWIQNEIDFTSNCDGVHPYPAPSAIFEYRQPRVLTVDTSRDMNSAKMWQDLVSRLNSSIGCNSFIDLYCKKGEPRLTLAIFASNPEERAATVKLVLRNLPESAKLIIEDPDEKQNVMALLKSLKREADALKRHRALPPKDSRPELIAEMAALQQDTDGAASTIKRGWV